MGNYNLFCTFILTNWINHLKKRTSFYKLFNLTKFINLKSLFYSNFKEVIKRWIKTLFAIFLSLFILNLFGFVIWLTLKIHFWFSCCQFSLLNFMRSCRTAFGVGWSTIWWVHIAHLFRGFGTCIINMRTGFRPENVWLMQSKTDLIL